MRLSFFVRSHFFPNASGMVAAPNVLTDDDIAFAPKLRERAEHWRKSARPVRGDTVRSSNQQYGVSLGRTLRGDNRGEQLHAVSHGNLSFSLCTIGGEIIQVWVLCLGGSGQGH